MPGVASPTTATSLGPSFPAHDAYLRRLAARLVLGTGADEIGPVADRPTDERVPWVPGGRRAAAGPPQPPTTDGTMAHPIAAPSGSDQEVAPA